MRASDKMNKSYCPVCDKVQNYQILRKNITYKKDNIEFTYIEEYALCTECGEELFIDEINQRNQLAFKEAYRKATDAITIDQINEILKKYRITKRNLSKILELGEITITRYLDGYIPTQKNSNYLKTIYNKPKIYYKLLQKNKNLIPYSAYIKSKNELDRILNHADNDTLIEDIAAYIINQNDETTPLMLQKLLYYVELIYTMFYNKPLYESQCKAWTRGPVYGRIYQEYQEYEARPIPKLDFCVDLNDDIKRIIKAVITNFGCYSGPVLSFFTHNEDPWLNANKNDKQIISKEDINNFSLKIKKEYAIENYEDIGKYAEKMFIMYKKVHN